MRQAALILAAALAFALPAAAQQGDWRTPDPENVLVIDTSQGRIIAEMSPELAPAHIERIKLLVRQGFYDGLKFFRVIDNFMAQTGDPQNNGTGASALPDLQPEFAFKRMLATPFAKVTSQGPDDEMRSTSDIGFVGLMPVRSGPQMQMMVTADGTTPAWGLFCPGVVGMARAKAPDSANSQFFIMRYRQDDLNHTYTPWARVISGLDAARKIKVGEPVPEPMDAMTRVRVLADIPAAERPSVQVMDTRGPAFKAIVDAAKAQNGLSFNICDVEIPAKVGG